MTGPTTLRFRIVNVFAESALAGNPLCVVEDGSGLDPTTMQAVARQFNLSETTFLLPAQAAGATARMRIFTPVFELPFAGHPTLGTAHVLRALARGGDHVAIETAAGVIPVEARGDVWTLAANAPTWREPRLSREQIGAMLGIDPGDVGAAPLWVDTGSEQLVIPLASADAVERCRPSARLLAELAVGEKRRGLAYVWARVDAATVRVRFFLAKHGGLMEDPGTGSACANLGGWFVARGERLPLELTVLQGDQVGRPCRLGLSVDATGRIFVSGRVIAVGEGVLSI